MTSTSPPDAQPLRSIVAKVKQWVERCGWVWAEAQVIEIRRRPKPTQFLTLRDQNADVSARVTCTAAVLDAAGPLPQGSMVLARLTPRVWAGDGSLSFECSEIRVMGEGQLLAQIEHLKRKLQAEGLFAPLHKKTLPFVPRKVGLITATGSAAERDVIANTLRRWPTTVFAIEHRTMQGPTSAGEVMQALAILDEEPEVDVIVIARGGGSLEDLLPFSDEGLVRAVFACQTPVVSAIGHEPDTPIVDLVADLRASTPTDAAKRIVPDAAHESEGLTQTLHRLRTAIAAHIANEQASLNQLRSRPVLRNPLGSFSIHQEQLDALRVRAWYATRNVVSTEAERIDGLRRRARALSPRATMERGYAIVATADERSVVSVGDVNPAETVRIYLSDGTLSAEITDINTMHPYNAKETP